MRGEKGLTLHTSTCPTQSLFFEKFTKGMLGRMGRDIRSNAGLSHLVLLKMINNVENNLEREFLSEKEMRFNLMCIFYIIVCFGASLRGCEGFMIERSDLISHNERGRHDPDIPHVVVPLLGRLKGETGEKSHLLLLANTTNSGIPIRKWVDRVVSLLLQESLTSVGAGVCNSDGSPITSVEVDTWFKTQVERVQGERPDLIEERVCVQDNFGIFRSMRKGSESRATEVGVGSREIDLINRWRKVEC